MTDAQFNKVKVILGKLRDKWFPLLGLDAWDIGMEVLRDEPHETEWDVVAKADTKWEYKNAALVFYAGVCDKKTTPELEEIFVHECCHILVAEMRDRSDTPVGQKHEERVVTELTRAIMRIHDKGRKR